MNTLKVKRLHAADYAMLSVFFLLVIFTVFPLFWMLVTALKTSAEISRVPSTVFPQDYYWGNFIKIFNDEYFLRYFLNSMIVAVTVTVIAVIGSTLVGFVFAKMKFPLKNFLFYIILITIMIPFEATVVPLYMIVRSFNAINTYQGLILPSVISSFGIFFMRQNIEQLPDSLLEAARIDGAGNMYIFRKIILPLSKSAISVLAVLLFLIEWSSYFWPLLVATRKQMFVLEIGLTLLQDEYFIDYGIMMAGCAVAMVPVMILYLFFRRNIMEGIALSGIKG